jgi:phage terminase Nu1 subunit (DNA packaging protein)
MKVSMNQLSELTGMDRHTVAKRLRDLPSEPGPRRAQLVESKDALRVLYIAAAGRLDAEQERAKLSREQRLGLEQRRRKEAQELIEAEDAIAAWGRIIGSAKAQLMGLPMRLAPAVIGLPDMRSIEQRIREEVFSLLESLADNEPVTGGKPDETD